MVSSYTTNKNLEKPGNGDYVDTWNIPVNSDLDILDVALGGTTSLNATSGSANLTSTQYQRLALNITGSMSANATYTLPSGVGGFWIVRNATTDASGGPWYVNVASGGGGSNVTVIRGKSTMIWSDGTNIRDVNENVQSIGTVTSVDVSGGTTGLTTSGGPVTTNGTITIAGVLGIANGGTNLTAFGTGVSGALSANATGSGAMVLSNGASITNVTVTTATVANANISNSTFTSIALGTPTSGNLTNTTMVPVANATGTLPVVNGGTGLTSFAAANNAIYSTSSNTAIAGTLPVAAGGTGATTLTANNVLLGNGTSTFQVVAPGTSGNVLTSNGTTWTSAAAPAAGKWEYIGSGAVFNGTVSFTNIGSYTRLVAIYFAGSNGGTPDFGLTVALSSNNGTSYGTARSITNGPSGKMMGSGSVTISNTNAVGTSKVINPYFAYLGTVYTTSVTETSITGVINAIRFVNTSGAEPSLSVALFGVP